MALTLRMVHDARHEASSDVPARSTTLRGLAGDRDEPTREVPRVGSRGCPSCDRKFSGESLFCPFDGDALVEAPDWNPAKDPLIGRTIDERYEVLSVLGEGGMGTVYEARHVTLERRFAVKVLRREIADAEHTARFVREAKAAAAIGHPKHRRRERLRGAARHGARRFVDAVLRDGAPQG